MDEQAEKTAETFWLNQNGALAASLLVDWYRKNCRDLPWRKSEDPYRIWISEIMLQQTQVETVIPYYEHFIKKFPDVKTLAQASEEEVIQAWKGLGYYRRASHLWQAARLVDGNYQGHFPEDMKSVQELPGIGAYTAGAILSIAFGQAVPAVDGNVLRVVARLTHMEEAGSRLQKRVGDIVRAMIPTECSGDFTQALMELGALVCLPANPSCDKCPLTELCEAKLKKRQSSLPMKSKKTTRVEQDFWTLIIIQDDDILMELRGAEGLLASMWGLPLVEKRKKGSLKLAAFDQCGLKITWSRIVGHTSHVFTHRLWRMEVRRCTLSDKYLPAAPYAWKSLKELPSLAVPVAFQKVLSVASDYYHGLSGIMPNKQF